jgi:hypothetical protein
MADDDQPQYLTIPNWQQYQITVKNGKPNPNAIRVPTNLEDDAAFMSLPVPARYLVFGIWRLIARTGKNVPNHPERLHRALGYGRDTFANIRGYIKDATRIGVLVLSSQQIPIEFQLSKVRILPKRVDNRKKKTPPSPPVNGDLFDVAPSPPSPPSPPNSPGPAVKKPDGNGHGHSPSARYSDEAIRIFRERYGLSPTWMQKDYVQLVRVLRIQPTLSVEAFGRAYRRFVNDSDPFYTRQAGALGFFCTAIDKFLVDPKKRPKFPEAKLPF